mmetsp:Transcript_20056/g.29747  ORF Transcript_20056/g.29747 Transcript_20056/m.29747 type:complete len:91 (+) Transcript_20056:921-1193(+)
MKAPPSPVFADWSSFTTALAKMVFQEGNPIGLQSERACSKRFGEKKSPCSCIQRQSLQPSTLGFDIVSDRRKESFRRADLFQIGLSQQAH